MSPQDRGKLAAALGHNQVCRHPSTSRTFVCDVMNCRIATVLDGDLFRVQGSAFVVAEMQLWNLGLLADSAYCGDEQNHDSQWRLVYFGTGRAEHDYSSILIRRSGLTYIRPRAWEPEPADPPPRLFTKKLH